MSKLEKLMTFLTILGNVTNIAIGFVVLGIALIIFKITWLFYESTPSLIEAIIGLT